MLGDHAVDRRVENVLVVVLLNVPYRFNAEDADWHTAQETDHAASLQRLRGKRIIRIA